MNRPSNDRWRWPPTLRETVAQLQAWRRRTAKGTLAQLKALRESVVLLDLYRRRWPAEFAASTAALFAPSEACDLYSAREIEFLHKLEALFPVHLDALLESDERWGVIPVMAVAYDLEGDWGPGTSLLLGLAYGELHRSLPELGLTLAPTLDPSLTLDLPALQERCLALDPTLHDIDQVLAVAGNAADNVWTDVTDLLLTESDGYPEWEAETIEALAAEWLAAKKLFDRFEAVAHWLDAARRNRHAFVRAWNASQRPRSAAHVTT